MTETPDAQLLEQFARNESEPAFAELVNRHISLVYSVAFRKMGNPQQAEDVTQAVFIILARKADSLGAKTVVPGWLYNTARLTAANAHRAEMRRIRREQEVSMQSTPEESMTGTDTVWRELCPQLDEAMACLGPSERDALVLRYFQNKSVAEVGTLLGVQENTAQKRVGRALEKLRKFFAKRGVAATAAIIGGVISANSVQAAPVGLVQTISAAAVAKGAAASTSTLTLVKGALKIMAWTKAKTAVVAAVVVILAVGTTTVVTTKLLAKTNDPSVDPIYEQIWSNPNSYSLPLLRKAPPILLVRPTHYWIKSGGLWDNDGKGFFVNCSVRELIGIAWNLPLTRMVFPHDMPSGNFDLMETLPAGQNTPALKDEIKKQFGLVGHTETRETDVLLLEVSDPIKLEQHVSHRGNSSAYMTGDNKTQNYHFKHETVSDLGRAVEQFVGSPILDRSGVSGHYNFELQWPTRLRYNEIGSALSDQFTQFGLQLVHSREPLEMLVVEKAN